MDFLSSSSSKRNTILNSGSSKKKPLSPNSDVSKSPKTSKKVTFSPDTAIPKVNNIALTITQHKYRKELGYTQYQIQLLYKGVTWTIYKRYRDFEDFHRNLYTENDLYNIYLPSLPKKRWFERQRWLNRFDETYSLKRRFALQDYLRILARIPIIRDHSPSFHKFLLIPDDLLEPESTDQLYFEVKNKASITSNASTNSTVTSEGETINNDEEEDDYLKDLEKYNRKYRDSEYVNGQYVENLDDLDEDELEDISEEIKGNDQLNSLQNDFNNIQMNAEENREGRMSL